MKKLLKKLFSKCVLIQPTIGSEWDVKYPVIIKEDYPPWERHKRTRPNTSVIITRSEEGWVEFKDISGNLIYYKLSVFLTFFKEV